MSYHRGYIIKKHHKGQNLELKIKCFFRGKKKGILNN